MEKYLNDTLRAERVKKAEEIAATNLMPGWLPREQYKTDSTRARIYFNLTKDSSYIQKYLSKPKAPLKKDSSVPKPVNRFATGRFEGVEPKKSIAFQKRGATA